MEYYPLNVVEFRKRITFLKELDLNGKQITNIKIEGFKSIKEASIDLKMVNVLIGSNGAGKSNFISIFKMMQNLVKGNLQTYIAKNGGPDAFLHFGSKITERLKIDVLFGNNGYKFSLIPSADNKMIFEDESFFWNIGGDFNLGRGHNESLWQKGCQNRIDNYIQPILKENKWRVYHFHDTSENAPVKRPSAINDNLYLADDARNLAAFLYRLKQKNEIDYNRIVEVIRMAMPFFDDFVLRPNPLDETKIFLEWHERSSDIPFGIGQLSDGSIRFICLTTLLMQPKSMLPDTIIIDEPELGLHPYAISLLASMIKKIAGDIQVIISTQSIELVDKFSADDIIVTEHDGNESVFKRLDYDQLRDWLEDDYSIGDLWKMNMFGGRP